jgi:hypothetical protein
MEETMCQDGQATPEPPRTLGEVIRRVDAVLKTAGAVGTVGGELGSNRWVLVELTEPYAGSLDELADMIRDALGDERIEVEVGFESAGPGGSFASGAALTDESPIDLLPWQMIGPGVAVRDHLLAEGIVTVGELEALPNSVLLRRRFSVVECAVIQAVLEVVGRIGESAPKPVGRVTFMSPIDELPWRRFGRHALFVRNHLRGRNIARVGQLEALTNRRLIDELGLSAFECAIVRAVLVEAGLVEG